MKRTFFSRKTLLRAIHAACVALFLAAATQKAEAQFAPPFQVNGSAVTTSSGVYTTGAGLYEPGANYSSLTIGAGVTINSTSAYGGSGVDPTTASSLVSTSASTFTNAGNLTLNVSSNNVAPVVLNQGAVSLTGSNSGQISGTGASSFSGAVVLNSTSGALAFTNSGSLYASGDLLLQTLRATSNSGDITLTNTSTGQISSSGSGLSSGSASIFAQTAGSGNLTITNNGILSSSTLQDIQATNGSGALRITNNGTINVASGAEGMYVISDSGPITLINNGNITGTNSLYGITAQNFQPGSGPITATNTGTISGVTIAIGVTQSGTSPFTITNSGTMSASHYGIYSGSNGTAASFVIRNTGSITSSGTYGIFSYSPATVYNTGSIHAATFAIDVPSGSFVTLAGNSDITGTVVGGSDSTSTSQLTFALSIPAAQLAAAQAQLAGEITAYGAQLGGDMIFVINGVSYNISNFDYTDIIGALTLPPVARSYAGTPGYQSMGAALDNLDTNNAQASTILNALGNVPDAGVANALAELSPKVLEIFSNVANNVATFNTAKINNHLANRRDGLTGFDATALNVQDSGMDPSLNQVRSHLLAYNPASTPGLMSDTVDSLYGGMDMKSTQVNTMPTDRWSSFIAGDVILADVSHNANLEDANYTTGNVTAGLDYRLDDHFTVGALFAYSHTDADLDSRGSSATVDSYSPGLYASYVDKGWYGNGLATYGRNAYTSDRIVDIPGLAGDNHGGTSGNQGTINLTGGYEFQRGSFKFGPVASVQYVHLSLDSMQEQGPTALTIGSQDQDSFRSQLGVEARFVANVTTPFGPMSLTPHASASWQHEYLDDSRGINAQFSGTGGGSFVTQTDNPDRDAAFIDVGLDAEVAKNVTVFVDYEAQAGQNNFFAQSAQGGVKIGF